MAISKLNTTKMKKNQQNINISANSNSKIPVIIYELITGLTNNDSMRLKE